MVPFTYFMGYFTWFLFIFDALLISIVIGLTFLSVLAFEYVEKGFLELFMCTCARKDRRLKQLIVKNLDSHRKRNSKTSIMFTLALGFLIFSASVFKLLEGLVSAEVITIFGADLYIAVAGSKTGCLPEASLTNFLQT